MNSSPQRLDSAAEEQAALWAARLDGSVLSAADRAALDAWLAENSTHRTLLSQYCQFSADLEAQLPALVATGVVAMPAEEMPIPRRLNLKWVAGGALAAAAAVALVIWFSRPGRQVENFATAVAQRQSLTLADGTRVELNARTSLLIENRRAERRVRLVEGEAFFVVSKDKTRPFIVETPAGSVRVTGTQFDVRAEAAVFEVTVIEGSVQVRPAESGSASAVPLKAGDKLSAGANGVSRQKLSTAALDDALAWRQGQIVFDGTPLPEAVARFARYHGRSIRATPDTADLHVGGRHSLDDLDGFLTSLEHFFPVRVTSDLNGNVQVSRRPER